MYISRLQTQNTRVSCRFAVRTRVAHCVHRNRLEAPRRLRVRTARAGGAVGRSRVSPDAQDRLARAQDRYALARCLTEAIRLHGLGRHPSATTVGYWDERSHPQSARGRWGIPGVVSLSSFPVVWLSESPMRLGSRNETKLCRGCSGGVAKAQVCRPFESCER